MVDALNLIRCVAESRWMRSGASRVLRRPLPRAVPAVQIGWMHMSGATPGIFQLDNLHLWPSNPGKSA